MASYNNAAKLPASERFRQSPYEEGVYFLSDTTWQVGKRYTLQKLLGSGSFSAVCLATDNITGEKVALKRIPNVLGDMDQAKRVLREVCILRRLAHPNIITLKDAFVTPAETGPCKMVNGRLVSVSLDLYLALKYADGGDLFGLKGQLSEEDVRWLMWQILQAVRYLHDRSVWHRDLKSANIMINWEAGTRIIKIGDFGSARSGYHMGRTDVPHPSLSRMTSFDKDVGGGSGGDNGGAAAAATTNSGASSSGNKRCRTHADPDYLLRDMVDEMHIQTVPSRLRPNKGGEAGPYSKPLTRVVATPCYRAPEVVMSRGGYTAAIDLWSIGCIFGELLQRVARPGSAATPQLKIAPLFAVESGMPRTPSTGEFFMGGPGCELTRRELQALFNVIGTPAWACVEGVQIEGWRHYLRRLPGKAPTLFRRFGKAGEPAVDLLQRFLAFDPARRICPEEALAHEYLGDVVEMIRESGAPNDDSNNYLVEAIEERSRTGTPRTGTATPCSMGVDADEDMEVEGADEATMADGVSASGGSATALAAIVAAGANSPVAGDRDAAGGGKRRGDVPAAGGKAGLPPEAMRPPLPPGALRVGGATSPAGGKPELFRNSSLVLVERHYYEEKDPAKALALLEEEMARLTSVNADNPQNACQALKELLEREVREVQHDHQEAASQQPGMRPPGHDSGIRGRSTPGASARASLVSQTGLACMMEGRASLDLQLDRGALEYCDHELAPQRLGHVADVRQGMLDPEKYLGAQRHGEWTTTSGAGVQPGPAWGVDSVPPGGVEGADLDPKMTEVLRRQQAR